MNPYDQAHQLANALRESEEYKEFIRLRDIAYENDANRALLDEYRRLQFRVQTRMASGERAEEENMQRLNQLGSRPAHIQYDLIDLLVPAIGIWPCQRQQ